MSLGGLPMALPMGLPNGLLFTRPLASHQPVILERVPAYQWLIIHWSRWLADLMAMNNLVRGTQQQARSPRRYYPPRPPPPPPPPGLNVKM